MSRRHTGPRRASVQVSAEAVASLPSISGRALHHYWSLLAPHFRGIFLPPLWRTDDSGLAWSWSEPAAPSTLNGADLATVRKRLAAAQRSLADAAEDAPSEAKKRTGADLAQLSVCTATVVRTLSTLPDTALAPFVVRCEHGLMVHSWGLPTALIPFDPETPQRSAGGTVFIGDQPGPHVTVTLSGPTGPTLAHQSTDEHGHFEFSKLAPGPYRLVAESGGRSFPVGGLVIDLDLDSATGLELRDTAVAPHPRPTASTRRGPIVAISVVLLALLVAGLWWWLLRPARAPAAAAEPVSAAAQDRFTQSPPTQRAQNRPLAASPAESSTLPRSSRPALGSLPPPSTPHATVPPRAPPPSPLVPAGHTLAPVGPTNPNSRSVLSQGLPARSDAPPAGPVTAVTDVNPTPPLFPEALAGTASTPHTAIADTSDPSPAPPNSSTPPAPNPTPPPIQPRPHANANHPTAELAESEHRPESPRSNPAASVSVASGRPLLRPPALETEPAHTPDLSPAKDVPRSSPSANAASATTVLLPEGATPPDAKADQPPVAANDPPAASNPVSDAALSESAMASALTRRTRLHLSAWQPRLVRDTILPTRPTSLRTGETPAALRARLMREQQQNLPADLASANLVYGIEVELAADQAPARWRIGGHDTASQSTASGTRATWSWSATQPPPTGRIELLSAATGHVIATIEIEGPGTVTIATTAPTRAWPWIAITRATPAACTWETLHDVPPPESWRLDVPGNRIDFAPSPALAGSQQRTLAVVDRDTGWALVSEVRLETDFPADPPRLPP